MLGEIWRLIIITLSATLFGLIFNSPLIGAVFGILFYLIRHLKYIGQLNTWLSQSKTSNEPPEGSGVWGDIFNRIYLLQIRNKKQKATLAAALTRFQQAASAMPDAMIILREEGKIEWFNNAAKKLLGLKSPQDIEQHITNLVRVPVFKQLVNGNHNEGNDIEISSPADDSILLSMRIVPYGMGKAILIARDITLVHQLEQVRQDFVANISHELRTPITVLSGYMETLLENKTSHENQWHEPMLQMRAQTNRMHHIVKDLLLLTRLDNFTNEVIGQTVNIGDMIKSICEDARILGHGKNQHITIECDESIGILGKPDDLESALSNLVTNAVRYTPNEGNIDIKWFANEKGAHFRVKDSGMGIAEMDIPRLTERFFRVDEARSRESGGTGLGLAIVKHVLQRHNAYLEITSQLNKGSCFTIHFPPNRICDPHTTTLINSSNKSNSHTKV